MGYKGEFGSFAGFQDRVLAGKVTADEADAYSRHIAYRRDDRQLDMRWHCYAESYPSRRISGRDDVWTRYAQSPEFAVSDSGRLAVQDATLTTTPGKPLWLLACQPSRTWVAYQANVDDELPITLDCPAGRLTCARFPLGKIAVTQTADGGVLLDADATPSMLRLTTKAATVKARIAGADCPATRDAAGNWIVGGKQGP